MASIHIKTVNTFELAWSDKKSGGKRNGSFYNPSNIPIGYSSIGSYGQGDYNKPTGSVVVVKENDSSSGALKHPTDFIQVYQDKGSGAGKNGSFWLPVAPEGYCAMGLLCVEGYAKPSNSTVVCLHEDLVDPGAVGTLIWDDEKTGAHEDGGFWTIVPSPGSISTGTFAGAESHDSSDAQPLNAIKLSAVQSCS